MREICTFVNSFSKLFRKFPNDVSLTRIFFMTKTDHRVQRTHELLQKALIELISENGYEAITIQDIVDRANVGRTTFYLHYNSKDELFMSCHEAIVNRFRIGPLHPLSREELLLPEAPQPLQRSSPVPGLKALQNQKQSIWNG